MVDLLCPHCKTEIDEHEANRCLDAWVWKAVFGLDARPDPEGVYGFVRFKKGWGYGEPVPYYSTDMEASWRVIETANDDNAMTHRWYNARGRTSFHHIGFGFGKKVGARASTMQLAVCRAALKAVGAT